MDHNEALRIQAAEKYVLGELPQPVRGEYEEHYFDCAECALDVQAAAAFVDASREVFRNKPETSLDRYAALATGMWFTLFRPAFALPVFAALLFLVAYQNIVTIPKVKEEATRGASHLFSSSFSLQLANTHGGNEVKVRVRPNESFGLDFDFIPARIYDKYVCKLQDETGRSLFQQSIPGTSANTEQHLVIQGGLIHPGRYHLVFAGGFASRVLKTEDEVLRLSFSVEFVQ